MYADRRTDGQTDTVRRIVAFRSCFAHAPKTYVKEAGLKDVEWVNLAQDGDLREKQRERERERGRERERCRRYVEIAGGNVFGPQREE